MSALQDEHMGVVNMLLTTISDLKATSENKVGGRLDLTKMYLARSKWHGAECIFYTHLVSRDITYWYQDYFI